MTTIALAGTVMIVLIFVTLAIGFPIGLSIGMGSAVALYIIMPGQNALIIAAQKMFQSVNSFSLLAIPFFVLAGNLMNAGPDQHRREHALRRHVGLRRCRGGGHGRYSRTS